MLEMLKLAAKYSASKSKDDRIFILGAVGIRNDGCLVHSRNEAVLDTHSFNIYKRFPESHAEVRLSRKLGFEAVVYVARVARKDGGLAMARPCECCQTVLKAFRAKKVYYTISNNEWGLWDPKNNTDTYYSR